MPHVLIVEDHEENRNLLKMLLEANGYRVTAAGDGLEALTAARRDPPEVVVSDVLMPKMDGFALCRAWMQNTALSPIPFIFYSATYVRVEDEQFAMAQGAVRYLIKPLQADVFLRELRAVLQQWAGRVAPSPDPPLDDATSQALHASALARKVEDKMAQLEVANRKLQESEARFRSLSEMSSDYYWESDAEHRMTQRASFGKKPSTVSGFERGTYVGERRWEIPYLSPDAAGWAAHRAVLDAHQPFREFELSRLGTDGTERFISISGDPVFDVSGAFTGYRGVGSDITERKRAEIARRESEARFRSLFESMLNGFAYCSMEYDDRGRPADFVYLDVNIAFERLTGLKNVVGRKVSEVIPGIRELSPELFEIYGRVASSGIPEVFEFDFKSFAKWLTISVYSPARGYFVAIFDDITERKRAEESLRESEQELRAIFEGALDGILVADVESKKILAANAAICAMLGYTYAEIVGISIADIHPMQDLPRVMERFERQLRGEIQLAADTPVVRKDGSVFYADIKAAPVQIRGKDVMLGIFRDATERKQAEEALARESRRNQAFLRGASDGVHVLDADGKVLEVSDSFCEMLGYSREELVGANASLWDAQWSPQQLKQVIAEQMAKEGRSLLQTKHRRRGGSIFDVEVTGQSLELDGKRVLFNSARDITERITSEAKIRRLNQLYAALSQCNEAIVRCVSEDELFPRICRAAVEFGGMKMAWIGLVELDTSAVRPAASFGDHAVEYLQNNKFSVDADSPHGRGPVGLAIRDNKLTWFQDFQHDPRAAPWHEFSTRFGWGLVASLPLCRNSVPVGALTLYATEASAFDEAARHLLTEMATDISFALDNFAHEAAREQAEKDLHAAEEQFRGLVEQSIAGSYIIQDGRFAYVNPRLVEIFGYDSADELIGRDATLMVAAQERGKVLEYIRQRIEGEVTSVNYSFTAVRKDGAMIEIGVHGNRATHRGRPAIIGLVQDISEKKRADEQIQQYLAQLENAFMSTVHVATTLGEMRDPYTAGHQHRVAEIAVAVGAELGFDARRQEGLRVAGYLHDIGKIAIPSEILSKPGRLTPVEFDLIKAHSQAGRDVLKDVKFPWPVAEIALQHHERMDGSGYPQGLRGEAILLEARIMAVADVIEAMSSHRPYRPGLGIDKALAEIERGRGTAYDAEVVDASLRLFREGRYQLPA